MAGMLPGVHDGARRRRCFPTNLSSYGSTNHESLGQTTIKRSSFCLYGATPSMLRNRQPAACDESELSAAAREAKKRLDERLQQQWRPESTKRTLSSQQRLKSLEDKPMSIIEAASQRGSEANKAKKSGSRRLNWLKMSWKSSEQEECAVCLERFKAGREKGLMQLPCGHKFHANCLAPWLQDNTHCPCCRMEITS